MESKITRAILLAAFTLGSLGPLRASPQEKIREIWRWHLPGCEVYEVAFSSKNDQIAFVRRIHIPDGHEAESVPEKELKAYELKIKRDQRYADPEITLMTIGTTGTSRLDWGWEPCFSPDGRRIAYSHQKNPIANYRDSALVRKENEIREYDLRTKASRTLAVSRMGGFLSAPLYSPDGRELIFSNSTGVNAGWQSAEVGVSRLVLDSMKEELLLPPHHEFGFLSLIKAKYYDGGKLMAIRARPSSGGRFLADTYHYELLELGGEPRVVQSLGEFRTFSEPDIGLKSPDGRYNLRKPGRTGFAVDGGEIVVTCAADPAHEITWPFAGKLQQVKWAPDSKRLAFVQTVRKGDIFLFDEIIVLGLLRDLCGKADAGLNAANRPAIEVQR